jgi:acyl carrier protein
MNETIVEKTAASLVANLIYQVNGILPINIKREDRLITDLEMDSVEMIDLIIRLEEIGVIIPESDITSSLAVADIIQLVEEGL